METIGEHKVWSLPPGARRAIPRKCTEVRKAKAHRVTSFMDLATKIAELQFMNRDHVLLFRGQKGDYKNAQGNTSLKPGLFRPVDGKNPSQGVLEQRFLALVEAERQLIALYEQKKQLGRERFKRQQILRWAILQHYEVCPTPLLDVTHSLRIAASFASDGATDEAFVFVLGVPNLSGAITASAEAGLQIIRLSSVCPPSAVRPHIQEGYLLGEYPEVRAYAQKQLYEHHEIDFGLRLVAKFSFDPTRFWKNDTFPRVGRTALYPDADDPIFKMIQPLKQRFSSTA